MNRNLSAAPLFIAVLITLFSGFASGCASSSPKPGSKDDYVQAFEAGRYNDAYEASSKAATRGSGFTRDQASLIAGLSAQALNRNRDAEKYLTPLVANTDKKIAGEAGAALGLIAAEEGRHDKAAELLTNAGRNLDGDQAARAYLYAGDSYKSLGKSSEAKGMWAMAQTKVVNDSSLRIMIGDRLSPPAVTNPAKPIAPAGQVRYTVQVGAFSSFTNAQKQLARYKSWGVPRVVELNKSGKKLFAVRVGMYPTKAQADSIKKSIGKEATVTTTAGE